MPRRLAEPIAPWRSFLAPLLAAVALAGCAELSCPGSLSHAEGIGGCSNNEDVLRSLTIEHQGSHG